MGRVAGMQEAVTHLEEMRARVRRTFEEATSELYRDALELLVELTAELTGHTYTTIPDSFAAKLSRALEAIHSRTALRIETHPDFVESARHVARSSGYPGAEIRGCDARQKGEFRLTSELGSASSIWSAELTELRCVLASQLAMPLDRDA